MNKLKRFGKEFVRTMYDKVANTVAYTMSLMFTIEECITNTYFISLDSEIFSFISSFITRGVWTMFFISITFGLAILFSNEVKDDGDKKA